MKTNYMPAAKRSVRAGNSIRTNLPTVIANYQMQPQDKGCIVKAAGITVTLPPYQDSQQGEDYDVASVATGNAVVTTATVNGMPESILAIVGGVSGSITADVLLPGTTHTYTRESDTFAWIRK